METRPHTPSDELDLHELLFRLRNRWPLFLVSGLLAGLLAFLYLQVKEPVYAFRATMLLGDQGTGSKQAQELLKILEVKEKGTKMEDEIGLLTSADMVSQALNRLPFSVAYYAAPATWLNTLKEVQVRERAAGAVPFRLVPDPNAPQLTDVRIYVEPQADGRFTITADADKGRLYSLPTGELVREVLDVHLNETVRAGDTLRHPLLTAVLLPEPGYPAGGSAERYFVLLRDHNSLIGEYTQHLTIKPIDRESRIIELTSKGTVPQKEVQFLDTLMQSYVENDLLSKNLTGQKTVAFLDKEIGHLSDSLRRSTAALSSFRAARGVVDAGAQSARGIQQQGELEMMRAKVATNRKYYQNMLSYLRENQGTTQIVAPSSVGIEDPVVNSLILQLTDLNSQRAALGVNASVENPMVTVLNERIKVAKESLTQTLANMTRAADITLRDLDAQLSRVRGSMSQMPENERQLASLQSKTDFNDKNYQFLIEKRAEAAIALATNATDKKVVDAAGMQGDAPTAPKPGVVMLIALVAGLGLPLGLTLLLDKANRRIQSKEDLSRITAIPLLGVVAHGSKQDKENMLHDPKGPLAESFRSIRVNLQYLAAGLDKKLIGVTSSVPGEGKTFCSVNLAAEMAQSGRKVLLLECDLRRPTVAGYFQLDNACAEHGLSSYLMGLSSLEDSRHPSGVRNLDVMCCGPIPANPTELLESARMEELLAQLRQQYDYVIVDTPPTGYVSEFFMLLRHLDANIYVVRQNYTDKGLISQINELHREQKVKHIYIVINDMHFTKTYEYRHKEKAYAYGY
ncbi:capsular exopolysaccharide synthesis family protein [Hymenobacter luteus]|uniref:non-specific protein-tyrosine kinase n=2 Tax=Hymenobacter TaxID=89966 RepID=A0A7W9T094_9BACT|nr:MULTISPECIES: polysaccharide biosynthesis tyrosine autokinase [Hymenobacter]MBB4601085.1 capsular exopolysaccharide synthesis family protein [Hymenobacter latericoloratus]MBB6058708.1 capsular exopolysaccharide synthesis family protein [Hymenobacter luteus]